MTSLIQATEVTAFVIGIGGAGAVITKGVTVMRRLGHFIDKLAGNGDTEPGIMKRLEELKTTVDDLTDRGDARDNKIDDLTTAVHTLTDKIDRHVDSDAPTWRAEGEAWGRRLDGQVAGLDTRVTYLENDPLTRSHDEGE